MSSATRPRIRGAEEDASTLGGGDDVDDTIAPAQKIV
jgi:hypothetical protein